MAVFISLPSHLLHRSGVDGSGWPGALYSRPVASVYHEPVTKAPDPETTPYLFKDTYMPYLVPASFAPTALI